MTTPINIIAPYHLKPAQRPTCRFPVLTLLVLMRIVRSAALRYGVRWNINRDSIAYTRSLLFCGRVENSLKKSCQILALKLFISWTLAHANFKVSCTSGAERRNISTGLTNCRCSDYIFKTQSCRALSSSKGQTKCNLKLGES